MKEKTQSLDAVEFGALVEVEKRLADFFDAEERFLGRASFQSLKPDERAIARSYATKVLLEIRYKALLQISLELGSAQARQGHAAKRDTSAAKEIRPVGKALILQCLVMTEPRSLTPAA